MGKFWKKKEWDDAVYARTLFEGRDHITFDDNKSDIFEQMAEGSPQAKKILSNAIMINKNWPLILSYLDDMNIRGEQIYYAWTISDSNLNYLFHNISHPQKHFCDVVNLNTILNGRREKAVVHGATYLRQKDKKDKNLIISEKEEDGYLDVFLNAIRRTSNQLDFNKAIENGVCISEQDFLDM